MKNQIKSVKNQTLLISLLIILQGFTFAEVIRPNHDQRALLTRMTRKNTPQKAQIDAKTSLSDLKTRANQLEKKIDELKNTINAHNDTEKQHPLLKQYDETQDQIMKLTHNLNLLKAKEIFVGQQMEKAHNLAQQRLRLDPVLKQLEAIVQDNKLLLYEFLSQSGQRKIDIINIKNRLAASIADVEYRKQEITNTLEIKKLKNELAKIQYHMVETQTAVNNLNNTYKTLQNRMDADAPAPAAKIRLRKVLVEYENTLESIKKLESVK